MQPTDRHEKQRRIAAVRDELGGRALALTSHEAVSWYLDGVRTHVSLAGPPVAAVRIDDDGDTIFVAANEAGRLLAEELHPSDADRVVRVPWQASPAEAAVSNGAAVAASEPDVAASLRAARASLLPGELGRYRQLGRETADAMTDAALELSPAATERDAAALVSAGLVARGIDPLVALVAGAARLGYRHPLPTDSALGERAMIVVCGRRHGLIANATRWVGASSVDDERILAVEAVFLEATTPGARLDDVFRTGCAAYAAAGFDADEWQQHHQGGPTGYAGRDPRATPSTADPVHERHAFAWNPTAPGVKIEDTVVVSSTGVEVLTADPRWPTVRFAGLDRPVALPFS